MLLGVVRTFLTLIDPSWASEGDDWLAGTSLVSSVTSVAVVEAVVAAVVVEAVVAAVVVEAVEDTVVVVVDAVVEAVVDSVVVEVEEDFELEDWGSSFTTLPDLQIRYDRCSKALVF